MKSISKNKGSQIIHYLNVFIQLIILFEQEVFRFNRFIMLCLYIMSCLQPVSYVILPCLTSQMAFQENMRGSSNQAVYYLPHLARPNNFISLDISDFPNTMNLLLYLIFLVLLSWTLILLILVIYFGKREAQISAKLFQNSKVLGFIAQIMAAFLQTLGPIIILPILEIAFITMRVQYSDYYSASYNLSIALVSVILVIFIQIIRQFISEETINFQNRGYEKLNLNFFWVLILLFKMIQVIMFVFIDNETVACWIQTVILTFITILNINCVVYLFTESSRNFILFNLLVQGISACLICLNLFSLLLGIDLRQFVTSIILITFGLCSQLLMRYMEQQELYGFMKTKKIKDPNRLRYLVALILQENLFDGSNHGVILKAMLIHKHKKKCKDVNCFCIKIQGEVSDPKHVFYLTDKIRSNFTLQILRRFNKRIRQRTLKKLPTFSLILHLLASLSLSGKEIFAYQQIQTMVQTKFEVPDDKEYLDRLRGDGRFKNTNLLNQIQLKSQTSQSQTQMHRTNKKFKSINQQIQGQVKGLSIRYHGKSFNFLQKLKLEMLQLMIRDRISLNFINLMHNSSRNQSEEFSKHIGRFMQAEYDNDFTVSKISKALKLKLEFCDFLINTPTEEITGQRVFEISTKIGKKLEKCQRWLDLNFKNYPSKKNLSVVCFFETEIISDYLKAYRWYNQTTISDERLLNIQRDISTSINLKDVGYLAIDVGYNSERLKIKMFSPKVHEIFKYGCDEFRSHQTADFVIPVAIKKYHNLLINNFFETGISKFFRNSEFCLVQSKNAYLETVNMFFDLDQRNLDGFSFVSFFEAISHTAAYIMVDFNGYIGGMTKNFFERIGFKEAEINLIDCKTVTYTLTIDQLIPNFQNNMRKQKEDFNDEILQMDSTTFKYQGTKMQFLKKDILLAYYKSDTLINVKSTLDASKLDNLWSSHANINTYIVQMIVNVRQVSKNPYYILEISGVKQLSLTTGFGSIVPTRDSYLSVQQVFRKRIVHHQRSKLSQIRQQEDEKQDDEDQILESELELSLGIGVTAQASNYCDEVLSDSQEEMDFRLPETQMVKTKNFQSKMKTTMQNSTFDGAKAFSELTSPDHSQIQFLNKLTGDMKKETALQLILKKQKFFSGKYTQSIENLSVYQLPVLPQGRHQSRFKTQEVQPSGQAMPSNTPYLDESFKLQNTDFSSEAGIRKSLYFKKYQILNKMSQSINKSAQVEQFKLVLASALLLSIAYSIILIYLVRQDLNGFLGKLDSLQVANYFLAPIVQFTTERQGIARYDEQLQLGQITQENHKKLVNYMTELLVSDYEMMKLNFQIQMSNKYLNGFFQDRNVTLRQGLNQSNRVFETSLREALFFVLEILYDYKLVFEGDIDKVLWRESPGFFFLYSNLISLFQQFLKLGDSVLDTSNIETDSISMKWNIFAVAFTTIVILTFGLSLYQFRVYQKVLEDWLVLFRCLKLDHLDREKIRLKLLNDALTRNQNLIFEYQFSLTQKEQQIQIQDQGLVSSKRKKQIQNQSHQISGKLELPVYRYLLIFVVISSFFFVISVSVNLSTQSWFLKSKNSASFLKSMSDQGFYLPYCFMAREVLYNFTFYPLNYTDRKSYKRLFGESLVKVGQYGIIITRLDMYFQIFTQGINIWLVVNFIKSLITFYFPTFVLFYLMQEIPKTSQFYCTNSFDGVMMNGLVETLVRMVSTLRSEYEVNEFTQRFDFPYLEIEAETITQTTIQEINIDFQQNIVSTTNAQMELVQTLSSFLILYSLILLLILYTYTRRYLELQLYLMKRCILLMPQISLFQDDSFERTLRYIALKIKII